MPAPTAKIEIDPMTGRKWVICGTTVGTAREQVHGTYARCGGCDRPVDVDDHGVWKYAAPHPTDKDLFLNALGALLASTMVSDLDDDLCERAS